MPERILVNGPNNGPVLLDHRPPSILTFPTRTALRPSKLFVAIYEIAPHLGIRHYLFKGLGRYGDFREGPEDGKRQIFASAVSDMYEFHYRNEPGGAVKAVARYKLHGESDDGTLLFEWQETMDLRTDRDHGIEALLKFYKDPNPGVYSHVTDRHCQIEIEVGERRATVDEGIADIIRAVWIHGWETMGSCQDRPADWSYPGKAYIWFAFEDQAEAFQSALAKCGVESTHRQKPWGATTQTIDGQSLRRPFEGRDVFFNIEDKSRILAALGAS